MYFLGFCYAQQFSIFINKHAQNCPKPSTQEHLSQFLSDLNICPYTARQHFHFHVFLFILGDHYWFTSLKSTLISFFPHGQKKSAHKVLSYGWNLTFPGKQYHLFLAM